MAKQLLDGSEVAAGTEEMGREGVAECVRRGGILQSERAAEPRDGELDDPRRQRPAACPTEERFTWGKCERDELEIVLDRTADDGKHRDDALAPAFSDDPDSVSAPVGASARFSPSASEMRSPQP